MNSGEHWPTPLNAGILTDQTKLGLTGRLKKNRRKGPDKWLRSLSWLTIAGWVLLFISFILFDVARPEAETLFHRMMGVFPSQGWNIALKNAVFYIVLCCQGLSVVGVLVNSRRMRRKSDRYRWSLMGLAIMSSFLTILFMFLNK